MSSTGLDRKAKGTEIITPRLDDDMLPSEELLSGKSPERTNLGFHDFFLFFGCHHIIIWIFWKDFYGISVVDKFTIHFEKFRIHDAISDIPTSGEEEFLSIFELS